MIKLDLSFLLKRGAKFENDDPSWWDSPDYLNCLATLHKLKELNLRGSQDIFISLTKFKNLEIFHIDDSYNNLTYLTSKFNESSFLTINTTLRELHIYAVDDKGIYKKNKEKIKEQLPIDCKLIYHDA